jgi:broad specificity phosphatase PhoE
MTMAVQGPVVGNHLRTWLRTFANVWIVVLLLSFKRNGAVSAALTCFHRTTSFRHHSCLLQCYAATKSTSSSSTSGSTNCNHLLNVTQLSNHFFAVRHGQSEANVARVIASNPATATLSFGLTALGRAAAENAARQVVQVYQESVVQQRKPYQGILVVSSDFLRAKETATILANTIQEASIPLYSRDAVVAGDVSRSFGNLMLDVRLRERWFGAWDGTSDANYATVWQDDAMDSTHTQHGVESVDSVIERATSCIVEWNDILGRHSTKTDANFQTCLPWMVLCVAHGDVLQILQTAFEKKNGRHHRSRPHLETAQLRPLVLAATTTATLDG